MQRSITLIENTRREIFSLIDNIPWESQTYGFNIRPNDYLKSAMRKWIEKMQLMSAHDDLFVNLSSIYRLLFLFNTMKQDANKPFQSLLTPAENTPDVQMQIDDYDTSYRSIFLNHYENEIKNLLVSKQLQHKMPEIAAIKTTLTNVKNMHDRPADYLEKPLFVESEKPQSKLKKYLTRASAVIAGILVVAMAIKLLPLAAIGLTIMHCAMYFTTGVGLLGYAEEKYTQRKEKALLAKQASALQPYKTEVTAMGNFFTRRQAPPSLQDARQAQPLLLQNAP